MQNKVIIVIPFLSLLQAQGRISEGVTRALPPPIPLTRYAHAGCFSR